MKRNSNIIITGVNRCKSVPGILDGNNIHTLSLLLITYATVIKIPFAAGLKGCVVCLITYFSEHF
jgi:hypothetical protein